MRRWSYGKTYKRINGRRRKIGVRNVSDRTAKRYKRVRVKGYVNNPDTSRTGASRKNYKRKVNYLGLP